MSEKITLNPHANDSFHSFLYRVLSQHDLEAYKIQRDETGKVVLDVELKINGLDISLTEYLDEIHEQLGQMVTDKARQLLKDKLCDFESKLSDLTYYLTQEIKREASKRFDINLYDRE